jgi:aryl-alcohol dehydrogenase-like predicted oxidoreductase
VRRIGTTSLDVFPLCLGCNVMGWSADERSSHAVLDAFSAAGGNFIDTADVYSAWVPGHTGGESETIIGRWMRARGARTRMVVATKVGMLSGFEGLAPDTIRKAAEGSLRRLGTDYIDVYYAHRDDPKTPLEDTLSAFDALVHAGKVRYIAASNYTAPRLTEALSISAGNGLASYSLLQPHYSLMHRADYEGALRNVCESNSLSCAPYFSLANGFLTGKYRPGVKVDSVRSTRAAAFLDDRGLAVLKTLDEIAAAHATTVAAVALAWLLADATIAAPIASARTVEQLNDLLPSATLRLTKGEVDRLSSVSGDRRV